MTLLGAAIEAEIAWFGRVLDLRFRIHAGDVVEGDVVALEPPPGFDDETLPYAEGVIAAGLDAAERLILILAMMPHLRPQALDFLLIANHASDRRFTEFGGITGGAHSGFRPTRETALFLLGGESMARRLHALRLFAPDRPLQHRHILDLPDEPGEAGPWLPLAVHRRWIERLTRGPGAAIDFGPGFAAQLVSTPYAWDDLVLDEGVRAEIAEIVGWVRHEHRLMHDWGLARHLKPGYRALFHGPPGTGKTMTAAVLGKKLDLPVYRVDLSRIVSKYIGETEKNLGVLFDHAAQGGMLLFFDEADALFGKRGDTRSANDRHANQQISYLLQRIEDCPGVVILATNLKGNIDSAFARRFQAMVHFPMPDAAARLQLWSMAFAPPRDWIVTGVELPVIARNHILSGGMIVNVLRYCCTHAIADPSLAGPALLRAGIDREMEKARSLGA